MVDNVFIQCDYCKAKIRMRFQMGYFDIPFDFPCPECGVHIHGLRRITEEHSLKLNNAAVVEFDLNEPHYYADFSVELPHAKTTKFESIEKIVTKGFSPFLMSSNLYKEDDYIHLIADMQRFLSFRDFFQLKLAPLYDLFFSGRISLTPEHFLKISPRFEVKNELDAMMALHQSNILGMSAILHDNALSEFAEITKKIIFSDKHKGRENAVELYLIDLAILCYENISVLTYLNELLYTLRKIEYVSEGMCIHIKRS